MIDPHSVGERIRALRQKMNLTQTQLARFLCVSPQAVSKWERGVALPDLAYADLLAAALDCSLDALFLGTPPKSKNSGKAETKPSAKKPKESQNS